MELVVMTGPDRGLRLPLSSAVSIGRDASNELVLAHQLVSGRHALIRAAADGTVELTDLSSTNGTRVNGVKISGPTRLEPRAVIQIGDDTLEVLGQPVVASSPAPTGPPKPEPLDPTASFADASFAVPNVDNAGPVAGGDVAISGRQAAGRDLHYVNHEGFQIKSKMSSSARRVLRWGMFFFVVGNIVGIIGFAIYGSELFTTVSEGLGTPISADRGPTTDGGLVPTIDGDRLIVGIAILGIGGAMSMVGLLMMLVSLVMRRDQVRERRG